MPGLGVAQKGPAGKNTERTKGLPGEGLERPVKDCRIIVSCHHVWHCFPRKTLDLELKNLASGCCSATYSRVSHCEYKRISFFGETTGMSASVLIERLGKILRVTCSRSPTVAPVATTIFQ